VLPLPITPDDALNLILVPALSILPARLDRPEARLLLIAIALQESSLAHRRQVGGPAMGLWQFERMGGVHGVLHHAATRAHAATVCAHRGIRARERDVYEALEVDDLLAACFARLLLYSDPAPLPLIGEESRAWDLYLRTWRPGRPHPRRWPSCYDRACRAVGG
jgi:hypothetical protein